MSNSFFIPGDSKYHNQGLIFSQRVNSTEKYKNSINCPKAFTTSTRIKEKLGLNPIKKIRIINRKKTVNKIDKMNKNFIKQIEKIHSNKSIIKNIIDKECNYEKELFTNKLYKMRCDDSERNYSFFRRELDKSGNKYARTVMLNRMIKENKRKKLLMQQQIQEQEKKEINDEQEFVHNEEEKNIPLRENEEEKKKERDNENNDINLNGIDNDNKNQDIDEKELKDIINYMNELDYDKYLENREIREALHLLKSKMEKQAQEKEEEEEKGNNEEIDEENGDSNKQNGDTEDTDKRDLPQVDEEVKEKNQEKEILPIIDLEKEKLKEKINEYHFIEKIAKNEPVRIYII